MQTLYRSNDNLLKVKKLRNASSGAFLNAATVTARLLDSLGALIAGSAITLVYQAPSDGEYHGTFESTIVLTTHDYGTIEVTSVESGIDGFWEEPARFKTREFC